MQSIPILSVAAYSGTGKTTFLEKLIPALKAYGLRICVLKHDAHTIEVDREGKDSWRITKAGADVTLLANDTQAVIFENRPVSLDDLLSQVHDVDLILTEGCKSGPWKKIALYRKELGKPFPCAVEDCLAIVTDSEVDAAVPCFGFGQSDALAALIVKELQEEKDHETR